MPYVATKGGSLYYEDMGDGGEPLVFVPGLGGDARAFAVLARAFSKESRVVVFDPRDSGRSFRADAEYSTLDMANDVGEALDSLSLRHASVVGHSLGGLVAQELAMNRPDLVGKLVLASTHAGSNTWRRAVISSWITMRQRCDPGEFAAITLPWLVAPGFYHQQIQVEGLIRFATKNEWAQTPDAFGRQARAAMTHDARGRLAAIKVPTLVLGGELDLVNPPAIAHKLAEEIPGASLHLVPDVGHMPHIEASGAFRSAVAAFLAEHA